MQEVALCVAFSNINSGFCATPKADKMLLVPIWLRKLSSNFDALQKMMQKAEGTQSPRAESLPAPAYNKLFGGY